MTQPQNTAPLPSAAYDKLKFSAQVLLPALAALYFGLSQIWHLPNGAEVSGTISLVNVFVGVVVVWLKSVHNAAGTQYDGELSWVDHDDGSALILKSIDLEALDRKGEMLLKVNRPASTPEVPPAA